MASSMYQDAVVARRSKRSRAVHTHSWFQGTISFVRFFMRSRTAEMRVGQGPGKENFAKPSFSGAVFLARMKAP